MGLAVQMVMLHNSTSLNRKRWLYSYSHTYLRLFTVAQLTMKVNYVSWQHEMPLWGLERTEDLRKGLYLSNALMTVPSFGLSRVTSGVTLWVSRSRNRLRTLRPMPI